MSKEKKVVDRTDKEVMTKQEEFFYYSVAREPEHWLFWWLPVHWSVVYELLESIYGFLINFHAWGSSQRWS